MTGDRRRDMDILRVRLALWRHHGGAEAAFDLDAAWSAFADRHGQEAADAALAEVSAEPSDVPPDFNEAGRITP